MAGRPPRTEQVKGVYIRIPPALIERVDHCQWLLMSQEGHKMTQNTAYERIIEAGCATLEGTLEGSETSAPAQTPIADISQISISKISDIAGDDITVPGYGFPEDEDEMPVPQRNGAAQHALVSPEPAILEAEPQREADPEQSASPTPALQPEAPEPTVQTVELPEIIVKIAEVRAEHFRMSERTFAQYLYEHDIYRHRAKDGREIPIPHTTLRKWLQQARDAGVL
jgi:hypothetical protein